jgi:hypothetical protein
LELLAGHGDTPPDPVSVAIETRFADARALKAYAGSAPVTRASGKKTYVGRRFAKNDRLMAAGFLWAFAALQGSEGANEHYRRRRTAGDWHAAAQRNLLHRLLGQLYHCLQTGSTSTKPEPDRPRPPKHVPPVWAGPPSDELPVIVSLGQFFYRSAKMVMAAKSVEVFSTGCLIEVLWSIRRGSESDREWSRVTDRCFNRGRYRLDSENGRAGALRFGVAFPDGRKATTNQLSPGMYDGTEQVTGPVLMMPGGGSGSGSDDEVFSSTKFWLWPLPLDGDTRVAAQWDDIGMQEASIILTGEKLRTAATKVQKFW